MARRKNPDFTLEVRKWLNSFLTRQGLSRFRRVAARIDDLVYDQQGEPDGSASHDLGNDLRALTTIPSGALAEPTALTYYVHDVTGQSPVVIFLTVCRGVAGDALSSAQRKKAGKLMKRVRDDGHTPSRY